MPTYDYACGSCGRSFEITHGIHAQRPTVCEVCGGTLRKQVSVPSIVFKGSGWAKLDSQAGARAKADKDAGPSEPSTTTAGDATPAAAKASDSSTTDTSKSTNIAKSTDASNGAKSTKAPKQPAAAAKSDSGRS